MNKSHFFMEHPVNLSILLVSSGLTEEQKEFQGLALNFAHNELFPNMAKWDQEEIFPIEVSRSS